MTMTNIIPSEQRWQGLCSLHIKFLSVGKAQMIDLVSNSGSILLQTLFQ